MYLRPARKDGGLLQTVPLISVRVVDCGLWHLAGWEDGEFVLNRDPKEFALVQDSLFRQARLGI